MSPSMVPWLVLILLAPAEVLGQAAADPGTLDLGVGLQWIGASSIGQINATETAPNGGRFRLFSTSSTLAPATGIEMTALARLSRALAVGAAASLGRSRLRVQIDSDAEGIPDAEAFEDVTELLVEAVVLVRLNWRPTARSRPFVGAGAGYLRHLHEGRTLVETGSMFQAGAGLDYLLGSGGTGGLKATGLRFEAKALVRSGGVAYDDRTHAAPAFSASLFARF